MPDMLQRAMLIGLKNDFRRDDEIDLALGMVTDWAAEACGFETCRLAVGERADIVLVDAQSVAEAVVAQPPRKLVISHGAVVARHEG
jgi:cytosine deaminase